MKPATTMQTDMTNPNMSQPQPQPQPQMRNMSDSYPPHGLILPGVQHSHAKIMQDYSYRLNNNPFFPINSQMSNLPMFHSPMQAFPYSQNSNQVINQSQTQPQMRNMSDPPHMQRIAGMSNYITNDSYPPHRLNLPHAPMNPCVHYSHQCLCLQSEQYFALSNQQPKQSDAKFISSKYLCFYDANFSLLTEF